MVGLGWRDIEEHEEDEACDGGHCHSCNVDHFGRAWDWCFECGHAYYTAKDLVRAYRRGAWGVGWRCWLRVWLTPTSRLLRPGRITFCPLCLHDF